MKTSWRKRSAVLAHFLFAASAFAVIEPEPLGKRALLFRNPELNVHTLLEAGDRLTPGAIAPSRFAALGVRAAETQVDLRTGRFATLLPGVPLLPGKGNPLAWEDLAAFAELAGRAPASTPELERIAGEAYVAYLERHAAALGIDPAELGSTRTTAQRPDHIVFYTPHRVGGLEVIGSHLTGVVRHGNLVLWGAANWGSIGLSDSPFAALGEEEARRQVGRYTGDPADGASWKSSELAWVPFATNDGTAGFAAGAGLDHRLVWVVRTRLGEDEGRFEAWVDAWTDEVMSLHDTKHYLGSPTSRQVQGGVFPVSNDGLSPGGFPDGVEQAGWPMPFAQVSSPSSSWHTDQGGNLPVCVDGSITTALTSPLIDMNDICGAESLTSSGILDWGVSSGTDCVTPGFGGAGNTHASRTGFYELTMIKQQAMSQLPANLWLRRQMTATMNIALTCDAFWDGEGVAFFRSGVGCFNTGELAGVFDHEWGHGMDANDATPGVSNPGEGIADVYASLRLHDSCIGRHLGATNCTGYGDACIACTGVRDIDFARHASNVPLNVTTADPRCGSGGPAPCGGSVHCEGQVYSQAIWDLWNRGLPGGRDRAREVATQLTYQAAGGVSNWFICNQGSGGCGAGSSGYLHFIVADDDNGSLLDGTPNMQDIFDAFNAHGIACSAPTVQESGCAGSPTAAPTVTATPLDRGVSLSWTSVPNASSYRVYRTDGVHGCDFGKTLVAQTSGTTFAEWGLQNGRAYSYIVLPMGASAECFGAVASSCTTATPLTSLAPSVSARFDATLTDFVSGDDDAVIDNCEITRLRLPISNTGTQTVTDLRIVSAAFPSHPGTTLMTSLPKAVSASLAACGEAIATLDFRPQGLAQGDELVVDLELQSIEMAIPQKAQLRLALVEGDLLFQPSSLFTFEAGTDGFVTLGGTFTRQSAGGGADGSAFYLRSSTSQNNACDVVRSPIVVLSPTSTMSLSTNFVIEGFDSRWWDRANVGFRDLASNHRTTLAPDTGRTYNAHGHTSTCGIGNGPGWGGSSPTWARAAGLPPRCALRSSPVVQAVSRSATAPIPRSPETDSASIR